MIDEKIAQAVAILDELDIDAWMIFGRESMTSHDPCADLVVGSFYTLPAAFFISRRGERIALVGNIDAAEHRKRGHYSRVEAYDKELGSELRRVLDELAPRRLAVNYSENDVMADGLSHGMYLRLLGLLQGTPYGERLVSSEGVVAALRGRKSAEELRRIEAATAATEQLYRDVTALLRPGRTEKEVHDWMAAQMRERGLEPAWEAELCPSVFTGIPEGGDTHTGPTDQPIEPGHVINMDCGVKVDGYCSDLQRTWYVLRDGESAPPPEVQRAFDAVVDGIRLAAEGVRPGMRGWQVDAITRDHITGLGYDEYLHSLGHQVGREPHDGGGLLGPRWERYGNLTDQPVEEGQVYTLEPRVRVDGHGTTTVEEIVVITPQGGRFLSQPQRRIWLVSG